VDDIKEIIDRYGLAEDSEHVIIPIVGVDGRAKRCFLLKRRFLRIMYPDGHYLDFPLEEIILATIKHPELPLREALELLHKELDEEIDRLFEDHQAIQDQKEAR
jgi:hypothetical protein